MTERHSLAIMTARQVAIVPHTHWDREWYKSYQDFRLALVELIDTLLPLLERDASYPHFMLDGQMAVVDDYLEVRPEAEARLRALAAQAAEQADKQRRLEAMKTGLQILLGPRPAPVPQNCTGRWIGQNWVQSCF